MQDRFSGFLQHVDFLIRFSKSFQIEIVAETFHVSVFWSYIKITHGDMIFIP